MCCLAGRSCNILLCQACVYLVAEPRLHCMLKQCTGPRDTPDQCSSGLHLYGFTHMDQRFPLALHVDKALCRHLPCLVNIVFELTQACTCTVSQQRCPKRTTCAAGAGSSLATDRVRLHASAVCTCKRWSGTQLCSLSAVAAGSNLCGNLQSLISTCGAVYLLMALSLPCCSTALPLVPLQQHSKHNSSCHCISDLLV